jgi:hypothetical protein
MKKNVFRTGAEVGLEEASKTLPPAEENARPQ